MRFSKLEGLGNDFIVITEECLGREPVSELSRKICDRHFGIGADGLLLVRKMSATEGADFQMRTLNSDGGEAELSGNGLRCLGAYLFDQSLASGNQVSIATLAGRRVLRLCSQSGQAYSFEVDMGEPILDLPRTHFVPGSSPVQLVGYELSVEGKTHRVTVSSMGNPHCSLFVESFDSVDWERTGAEIECHASFPKKTNVEFIRVLSRHEIEVRFWERGAGKTLSSGTGSCAATVASVLNQLTERSVRVHTAGGVLEIEWDRSNRLKLKGPARLICSGEYFHSGSF